ncbi:hypothetical protein E4Z66_04150 [Aliishimia ponticola]|uniref:Uncharacterized protein n=1 Tax=Aliishimia ponticola TaxID=2499833 RepID=A0A4V3XKY4_9RHOB|nr:hypothetical protein [Aliishimia ponticola]THH38763.1 hypothetical protein E4Z66_04150 [Aliishimia ponticola]
MSRFHPVLFGLIGLLTTACAPQNVAIRQVDLQDVPRRTAFFATNPMALDEAFKEGCNGPGDIFRRIDGDTAQCALLPTPEGAAFLLVTFDAQLEEPRLIVEKRTRRDGDGYRVEMSYYAEVLAKTGKRQRIYMPRRTLDRQIDMILTNSGGQLDDRP